MEKMQKGSLTEKIFGLIKYAAGLRVPVYAAHASFFMILSLFPMLVLLLGLLRYTGISVSTLTDAMDGLIPAALLPSAKRLIVSAYRNTTSVAIGISAVTALWSAGRGVYSLLAGLNSIYGVKETRGYLFTRGICTFYTLLLLAVLLLTLILYVFSTGLMEYLQIHGSVLLAPLSRIVDLRLILLLGVQTLLFTAIYTVLPNRKIRLRDSFIGAVLASVGWLTFSHLYSKYVLLFPRYARVYGSVYVGALSMLWLYFCLCIVFYGGALNHLLIDRKTKD